MIDKTKIKGEFIIDISPTNINIDFIKKKFGESLKYFDFSLNDIIQLSKLNVQKRAKGLYNRSLFVNNINSIPIQNKESFEAQNN